MLRHHYQVLFSVGKYLHKKRVNPSCFQQQKIMKVVTSGTNAASTKWRCHQAFQKRHLKAKNCQKMRWLKLCGTTPSGYLHFSHTLTTMHRNIGWMFGIGW
ncbi:hypothetical protein ES332_D08G139900v1 [Gossypium tomentosum]|uniref:Uncharacterized protein n=1 Tax=Gossypium tomentosum TaxID=34277 RepID=A0A5D2JUU7_GOSTO|nr:hypothetical protein ES332_D08G139900v1 [Gossypium tomentosum]